MPDVTKIVVPQSAQDSKRTHERDPLWVAAYLLCEKAGCLPLHGIAAGDPTAIAPDGRSFGWAIDCGDDMKMVFLFDDVAYLCDSYLADGSRITHARIQAHWETVAADPGNTSLLKVFSKVTRKEITRIPASAVAAAVEANIARQEGHGSTRPADAAETPSAGRKSWWQFWQ